MKRCFFSSRTVLQQATVLFFISFWGIVCVSLSITTLSCTERTVKFKNIRKNVAYVTGWVGDEATLKKMARIPPVPLKNQSYFVSNNRHVLQKASLQGWKTTYYEVMTDEALKTASEAEKQVFWTNAGKRMKVFPQSFISDREYHFVAWLDNKWNWNTVGTEDAIARWNPDTVVQFHRHEFVCCGADLEYKASMPQPRYYLQRKQYQNYMYQEVSKGFLLNGPRHPCATYILYNLRHNASADFQNTWFDHIQRCGIQDQISLYFVAQRFPAPLLAEYLPALKETFLSLMYRKLTSFNMC